MSKPAACLQRNPELSSASSGREETLRSNFNDMCGANVILPSFFHNLQWNSKIVWELWWRQHERAIITCGNKMLFNG